jgi:Fe-S cluster biogenesis protein NfuA
MPQKREFQARTERIEELVHILESADDPKMHAVALELMQSVMQLHGAGLEKILGIVSKNPGNDHLMEAFVDDELVSSLLLLHDLHPEDMETRVLRALARLRPNLQSQSADAELLGVDDGAIRLRIHGTIAGGCHASSAAALKSEVEDAIYQAAPDATQVTAEEVEHPRPAELVILKGR